MRGRGIDFEHRFNTSRWAEDLLMNALNASPGILALRFGLSRVQSSRELAEMRGEPNDKEPDLLVIPSRRLDNQQKILLKDRKLDLELAPREEFDIGGSLDFVLPAATAAIEVEFSPYRANEMKGRNWIPKTEEEWERRPLKTCNPPVAPNIFVKEEDIPRLVSWEKKAKVPLFIAHVFDQESFACRLSKVVEIGRRLDQADDAGKRKIQHTTGVFRQVQVYDRTDAQGARESKVVYRVHPAAAMKVGDVTNVKVGAQIDISSSKKYVSHVLFTNGSIEMSEEFSRELTSENS